MEEEQRQQRVVGLEELHRTVVAAVGAAAEEQLAAVAFAVARGTLVETGLASSTSQELVVVAVVAAALAAVADSHSQLN